MKHFDLQNLPQSTIKRRFTKRVKEGVLEDVVPPTYHDVPEILHISHLGTLNDIATQMNSLASRVDQGYNIARDTMKNLIVQFQTILEQQEKETSTQPTHNCHPIRDLVVVQNKVCSGLNATREGKQPRHTKRCTCCHAEGHNKVTYSTNVELPYQTSAPEHSANTHATYSKPVTHTTH